MSLINVVHNQRQYLFTPLSYSQMSYYVPKNKQKLSHHYNSIQILFSPFFCRKLLQLSIFSALSHGLPSDEYLCVCIHMTQGVCLTTQYKSIFYTLLLWGNQARKLFSQGLAHDMNFKAQFLRK